MNEISFDFVRAMTRIVMDAAARRASDPSHVATPGNMASEMLKQLKPPAADPPRLPPAQGTIVIDQPPDSFRFFFSEFLFNSFLTKPEIIKIIVQVKAECLKVVQMTFFTFSPKTETLEGFQNLQSAATKAAELYLKVGWRMARYIASTV